METKYSYFQHRECEFFPCHKTADKNTFNCLFCYCPLYTLGNHCGGNFSYTDKGVKDCSNCLIPHSKNGYEYITSRFNDIVDLATQNRNLENN